MPDDTVIQTNQPAASKSRTITASIGVINDIVVGPDQTAAEESAVVRDGIATSIGTGNKATIYSDQTTTITPVAVAEGIGMGDVATVRPNQTTSIAGTRSGGITSCIGMGDPAMIRTHQTAGIGIASDLARRMGVPDLAPVQTN